MEKNGQEGALQKADQNLIENFPLLVRPGNPHKTCLLEFVASMDQGLLHPLCSPWDFFFCFLGLHSRHMEVSRLRVELDLQRPAYTIAIAMQDPSCICNLHHSSWQHWILTPLSVARDRTLNIIQLVVFVSAVPRWELLCGNFVISTSAQ